MTSDEPLERLLGPHQLAISQGCPRGQLGRGLAERSNWRSGVGGRGGAGGGVSVSAVNAGGETGVSQGEQQLPESSGNAAEAAGKLCCSNKTACTARYDSCPVHRGDTCLVTAQTKKQPCSAVISLARIAVIWSFAGSDVGGK